MSLKSCVRQEFLLKLLNWTLLPFLLSQVFCFTKCKLGLKCITHRCDGSVCALTHMLKCFGSWSKGVFIVSIRVPYEEHHVFQAWPWALWSCLGRWRDWGCAVCVGLLKKKQYTVLGSCCSSLFSPTIDEHYAKLYGKQKPNHINKVSITSLNFLTEK